MAGEPSGGVGLLCVSCRVPSFSVWNSALKADQAWQGSLLSLARVPPGGELEKLTVPGRHSAVLHTLPDAVEVEHKPVSFHEKQSFITGFLQQEHPGPSV